MTHDEATALKAAHDALRAEFEAEKRRARRRLIALAGIVVAAVAIVPVTLAAAPVTLYTFSNNTVADAAQVNANFVALRDAIPTVPAAPTFACTCNTAAVAVGVGANDVTATLAAGYVRTGGGCWSDAPNERQLLRTAPVGTNQWNCRSTDEDNARAETLTAYVCGCRLQ